VGQDISNGCVRLPNDVVDFIAANVPAGTPVDVVE
jgi:lipoprotein-anchoring transpeptidase ErfK/SrfK